MQNVLGHLAAHTTVVVVDLLVDLGARLQVRLARQQPAVGALAQTVQAVHGGRPDGCRERLLNPRWWAFRNFLKEKPKKLDPNDR